jgi:hypothetical protein
MKKTIMISQPMRGLTEEQIVADRSKAIKYAEDNGYDIIHSHFTEYPEVVSDDCKHVPLHYLSKSINAMSKCDAVYFCLGYVMSRGCQIEHDIAKVYGLKIIYETV